MRPLLCFFLLICSFSPSWSIIVYDQPGDDLAMLLSHKNSKVILRYSHKTEETINVAENCDLCFVGGSLLGNIIFDNTRLSGDVNLRGANIKGSLKNRVFNALWLCYGDGIHDDAESINSIIKICDNVYFPRGTYRLISEFKPEGNLDKKYYGSVKSHIGINRNDITLVGDSGTIFYTDKQSSILCVYSMPYNIEHSTRNISIKNIEFVTKNDGSVFLQWTHAIKIIGVNGLDISNCTISDFWGDAIGLSHYGDNPETGERTRNQNVRICNNVIIGGESYNNRNAISVINGKNVLIKNNSIKNVSQDKMPGGIDIEPNNSAYTIDNIRVENNRLENIKGGGGAIGVVIKRDASAKDIYILNNVILNSRRGIRVWIETNETTDNIQIKNNETDERTPPYLFLGEGSTGKLIIKDNVFNRPSNQDFPGLIKAKVLRVKNNKKKII